MTNFDKRLRNAKRIVDKKRKKLLTVKYKDGSITALSAVNTVRLLLSDEGDNIMSVEGTNPVARLINGLIQEG